MKSLEVLFTPAEFSALSQRDLRRTVCVVFDVLRATSTMLTALGNGAEAIIPVAEIAEALAIRRQRPEVMLAGERDGVLIRGDLTGGIDFDLGNSPGEFTADKVRGRTIAMTTTNGTRALRACSGAGSVLIGSFLNLRAVTNWIERVQPASLLLVCSGTLDDASLEDTLAAGALCDRIWAHYSRGRVADSAEIARRLYQVMGVDLLGAMNYSRNGRRLLADPALRPDVRLCLERESPGFVAGLQADGSVRRLAVEE